MQIAVSCIITFWTRTLVVLEESSRGHVYEDSTKDKIIFCWMIIQVL